TNLRIFADRRLKAIEKLLGLALKRDPDDDDGYILAGFIDKSRIATDHTVALQNTKTPQARRRREAHLLGKTGIAHAPVQPQQTDNLAVGGIERAHAYSPVFLELYAISLISCNFMRLNKRKFKRSAI